MVKIARGEAGWKNGLQNKEDVTNRTDSSSTRIIKERSMTIYSGLSV